MSWARSIDEATAGVFVDDLPGPAVGAMKSLVASLARDLMVAVWPVDSGRSLAGWRVSRDGDSWELRNDVEYAEYVHIQNEYGGPPGLADRRWLEILSSLRDEFFSRVQQLRDALQSRAARGGRGTRIDTSLRLVEPRPLSQAPAARTARDPFLSGILSMPSLEVPAASVAPIVGAAAVGATVTVASPAVALVAESLLARYVRDGTIDAIGLSLLRAGRLNELERRLTAQRRYQAASAVRRIISQQQAAAA